MRDSSFANFDGFTPQAYLWGGCRRTFLSPLDFSLKKYNGTGPEPWNHSSMGSKEKSALLSAPQTDHRFLSLLLLKLLPRSSKEGRFGSPSSPLCLPSSSSSMAASSASGMSSIVSRELIDGDLDLIDVGVLGIEDAELNEYIG